MAVKIVDALEMIEVEDEEHASPGCERGIECAHQLAPVGQTRGGVGIGIEIGQDRCRCRTSRHDMAAGDADGVAAHLVSTLSTHWFEWCFAEISENNPTPALTYFCFVAE